MLPFYILTILILPLQIPARQISDPVRTLPVQDQKDTWRQVKKYRDIRRGSHVIGMTELKNYLHRFGYLPALDKNYTDSFDSRVEYAIAEYQAKLGLPVSGKLDSGTISQIMLPRCGVPDTLNAMHGTRRYEYFIGQPRWERKAPMTLTYAFLPANLITSLGLSDIRTAFKHAFARWASVIPVSFLESDDYGFADIRIGFYRGDHGDGEPFDGELGVLAHSFSPESGRLHLDAAEVWAVNFSSEKSEVAVDLESVATHEIGHLLGLAHTSVKEAVMYPSLKPRERKLDLKLDDIQGIQKLYGSNPNFRLAPSMESDISSNLGIDLKVRSSTLLRFLSYFFIAIMHVIMHA